MSLRRYVPSGRGGPVAIPAVLAASVLAGVILGVIEGVVSRWLSLFILFPIFIGIAAGAAAAGMIARFKLRAPALAVLLGLAGGAAGYVAQHATVYLQVRSEVAAALRRDQPAASDADISAKIDELLTRAGGAPGFRGFLISTAREGVRFKLVSNSNVRRLSFKDTEAWILWAIELLGAAAIAAVLAWSRARAPFCEDCNTWYGAAAPVARGGAGSKAMQRKLLAALDTGDVDGAVRAFYGTPDRQAIFELTAASCPHCSGDAYCQLDRVVVAAARNRTQRSKLATWLMPRAELSQLIAAMQRANSPQR
jgi:hypothetical protein